MIPTLARDSTFLGALRSLERQTFREFQTVVVDNSGERRVRRNHTIPADILVLEPDRNLGFGAAVNLGWKRYPARHLATLNDDAEAHPGWLAALYGAIEAEPGAGMCASQVQFAGTDQLDSAGMLIAADGSSKQRGHGAPPERFRQPDEVLCPSGSAALYRGEMLRQVGLFPEDFFLYCEDTDLGLRARRAGWGCRYVPEGIVEHHYSASAGRASALKAYLVERNRLAVAIRNFPWRWLLMAPPASVVRYGFHVEALWRGKGRTAEFRQTGGHPLALVWYVLKAHLALLPALPRLWRERRAIHRRARMTSPEFCRLLARHRVSLREVASA